MKYIEIDNETKTIIRSAYLEKRTKAELLKILDINDMLSAYPTLKNEPKSYLIKTIIVNELY